MSAGMEENLPSYRIGKFEIDCAIIRKSPRDILVVTRDVAITRAEALHHRQTIEYIGICDAFREIPIGEEPPYYQAILRVNEDGVIALDEWREVKLL